jgi:small-conductance mechanosensitive channel
MIQKTILPMVFLLTLFTSYASGADRKIDASAFVKLGELSLFPIQAKLGTFSTEERAATISKRIETFSANWLRNPKSITLQNNSDSIDIVGGDQILLSVTEEDSEAEKKPKAIIAQNRVEAIREGIIKIRDQYKFKTVFRDASIALAVTCLFGILLYLLGKLYSYLVTWIQESQNNQIRSIRIKNFELFKAERIIGGLLLFLKVVRLVTVFILFYIYITLVLGIFPWTAGWAHRLFGYILDPLRTVGRVTLDFIPNLFFILVIFALAHYVLKFIHMIFDEIQCGSLQFTDFPSEWAEPTYKLVRGLILAFALIIVFPYLPGSGSPAFQGISVFFGILISLGSSSAIGNMVGGIVLTYMRPFRVGDRVKIADTVGDVVEKSLLVTRIRTIKNVDVTIPNSIVLGGHIVNYNSSAFNTDALPLILHTQVTIGYDAPWRKVHELLIQAALDTENILKEPKPFVLQTSLDDNYVSYEINASTSKASMMANTYSTLHQNIQDNFNKAGVEIMSPHFAAVRDGNRVTLPSAFLPENYEKPEFKVSVSSKKF